MSFRVFHILVDLKKGRRIFAFPIFKTTTSGVNTPKIRFESNRRFQTGSRITSGISRPALAW